MPMKFKWKKPDPALADRFNAALPGHAAAERKKMFGYPACFVNGNFFAGMHEETFVVRLPGGLRDKFPVLARAQVFDPMRTGKGMKDWWVIPAAIARNDTKLRNLLNDTFAEVVKLPPKPPKSRAVAKPTAPRSPARGTGTPKASSGNQRRRG